MHQAVCPGVRLPRHPLLRLQCNCFGVAHALLHQYQRVVLKWWPFDRPAAQLKHSQSTAKAQCSVHSFLAAHAWAMQVQRNFHRGSGSLGRHLPSAS